LPGRPRAGDAAAARLPAGPRRRRAGRGALPARPRRPGTAALARVGGRRRVRRRRGAGQRPDPERDRPGHGGADDPRVRHRRAETALAAPAVDRRGSVVPAVQRARRRVRPGRLGHPGGQGRRRPGLAGERAGGVDVAGAQGTLMNERVAIGGGALPREGGTVGLVAAAWRAHPELRTPGLHDRMIRLWADAEIARLATERLRQQLAAGQPGPEGSAAKIVFARLNQELSALELELSGADGLRYDDWSQSRPETVSFVTRGPGYRYLRARANSIEGGTSEIL